MSIVRFGILLVASLLLHHGSGVEGKTHGRHLDAVLRDLKELLERASHTEAEARESNIRSTSESESGTSATATATYGGNGKGAKCVLPFTYRGTPHTSCIGSSNGLSSWCAVTKSYDVDGLWGYCLGVVLTTGGNAAGAQCVFPFEYDSTNYSTCITSFNQGILWCATTSNYTADQQWGNCQAIATFGGSAATGSLCVFPFSYGGVTHHQCTTTANNDIPWCATEWEWGNCRVIQTSGGNADDAHCVFPFTYNGVTYTSCVTAPSGGIEWCSTTPNYDDNGTWAYCREVATFQGNANNSMCVFPFIYQGVQRNTCLSTHDHLLWCATTRNYDQDGLWGYCRGACGYRPIQQEGDRIVGGVDAIYGAFPWQVAIPRKYSWGYANWCGGTVISDRWVLSAAHCFRSTGPEDHLVRTGSLYRSERDKYEQELAIERIISHPGYVKETHDNDIALIRVDGRIYFNNYTQSACLPSEQPSEYETGMYLVSGWGRLEYNVGVGSERLQAASVPLVDHSFCASSYQHIQKIITPRMVCAGFVAGGIDACSGDSGGPLVRNVTDFYTVLGVTSFGYGCARPDYPGVYAKVQEFLPWINQTMVDYA